MTLKWRQKMKISGRDSILVLLVIFVLVINIQE
jgi:hypothetical protein